jgi:glucose/arabinose dehydrogenase
MKRLIDNYSTGLKVKRGVFLVLMFFSCAVILLNACVSPAGLLPSLQNLQDALKQVKLPKGFHIELYIDEIEGARSMCLGTDGILYVGSRSEGNVYAVLPSSGNDKEIIKLAEGLNSPNGVAFRNGDLYVAEIDRVLRFNDIGNSLKDPSYEVISDAYPSDGHHGWKFIRFGPDGLLYVPVGMPCNVCNPDNPIYGTITRLDPENGKPEIIASGIRNTVGFDWHPQTKELWFTDNGRDWMGDNQPPDELNRAPETGMHFGFPYCHGNNIPEPEFSDHDCSEFTPPALELGPHVAAIGMRFYTGTMFPEKYHQGIFIAEHGSWNRTVPIGYRVMYVNIENNEAVSYEIFAEGWLKGAIAWGRPVDVLVLPDGALLVSDDKADAIYRISYQNE